MRGFSKVTLVYFNYYYQYLFSGSRLCLKVSKEEEAFLKASQHRSKTGGKPEVSNDYSTSNFQSCL